MATFLPRWTSVVCFTTVFWMVFRGFHLAVELGIPNDTSTSLGWWIGVPNDRGALEAGLVLLGGNGATLPLE